MTLFFLFLGFDIAIVALHYIFGGALGFFHIEKEQNLASVYSGLQLIAISISSFGIAAVVWKSKDRFAKIIWFFMGIGLLYMGVDEMAVIHERFGFVANNQTGLGGYYGESFNWLLYYTPPMIAAVLVFWGVFRLLLRDVRPSAWLFLVGVGILFVALGLEVWGGKLLAFPIYQHVLVAEEFFEMLGETFVLTAVASAAWKIFHQYYQRSA